MIVGKAIYYLLTNATDVTDIVSTRIYPEVAQQDADLPFIVYNVTNNEPTDTKPEPSKLDTAQVEVNIYSDSYRQVIDLSVAVRAALDRVKGTYSGVDVQSIQYLNEVIDFDEPQRAYNISADYDVRISRSGFVIAQGSPITGVQLGELSDVDVTGVTNGQLIAYNSTTEQWEAADDAGGAETLDDLTDVDAGAPSSGQLLAYGQDTWETIDPDEISLPIGSVTGLQGELDSKAESLNDLSDVTITGTPTGNQALIYDASASVFKSTDSFTNRFEDDVERGAGNITPFVERAYGVKADGDGIFIDSQSDTPSAGKVIKRKIYHKAGLITDADVIGDYTLIHTFDDDTTYANTESTFEGFRDGDTYGTPPYTLIQTWEEEDAAPAFTGLLNESYGSGAAAAYSVRRLNGNYTGAAIQVERSSDNTTQDIGFDANGDLDESALTTFCTGTTCKVRTWYDQSQTGGTGSGNDATQTDHTKQPTIYTGGAIVKQDGRVALDFDGTNDFLSHTQVITGTTARSFFFAHTQDAAGGTGEYAVYSVNNIQTGTGNAYRICMESSNLMLRVNQSSTFNYPSGFTPTMRTILSNFWSSGGSHDASYFVGGKAAAYNTGTSNNLDTADLGTSYIGYYDATGVEYDGSMHEVLVYDLNKSTDRSDIEENIGDYFTQNTPLLDTYTGAAAAYSLRKLRTAYTGSAIRVRRSNDNAETDIGFNCFGELDTVSLAAHCGSNDGFVKTWYDQSGNANNATQTTAAQQPKIYDGSTGVVTENGKPSMDMNTGNCQLFNNSVLLSQPLSFFITGNNGSQNYAAWFDSYNDATNRVRFFDGSAIRDISAGTSLTYTSSSNIYALRSVVVDSTNSSIYFNGSQKASGDAGTNNMTFGRIGNWNNLNGTQVKRLQEFIVYEANQSSNRTNIEDNINTFYDIY